MAKFKRILLKLSGESLMGEKNTVLTKKGWANMHSKSRKSMTWAYRLASSSVAVTFSADCREPEKALTA